jgi:endosialidase-like protein
MTAEGNTANGALTLFSNTTGAVNTAVGGVALLNNTTGNSNTAVGIQALVDNTTGGFNTAVGDRSLNNNTTGGGNTALGLLAGANVTTANSVICIGSSGGNVDFTTWIENVYGVTTVNGTTAPVVVSADGQLGTVASSKRFKKDIATMQKASESILSLRPVTFHYKTDTTGISQFGLIAEEVAKVNPALVLPDKEGKPYTVRYDAVNAMLLNEFLKEHQKVEKLEATVAQQHKDFEAAVAELKGQIQKVSTQLEANKPAPQMVLND